MNIVQIVRKTMRSFSRLGSPRDLRAGRAAAYAGLSAVHISETCFVPEEYDSRRNALRQERWETIHEDDNTDYKMSRQDWLQVEGIEMNI